MNAHARAVLLLSSLLLTSRPIATLAADDCKDVLADGIWDYSKQTKIETQTSSFLNWFCSKTFSSYQQSRDAAAKIGIPLEDLPLELEGKYRDTQWSEYRNEMCTLSQGKYKHATSLYAFARKASAVVVQAWEACVNRYGTFAWLSTTDNPNAFALQVRRRVDIGKPDFKITQISVSDGTLTCDPVLTSFKGKTFTGSASTLCTREDEGKAFTLLPIVEGLPDPLPALTVRGYKPLPPTPTTPEVNLKVFHAASASAQHPHAEVAVPNGYKVVGCGARVNYAGAGNMLTAVYPTDQDSCVADAKDHNSVDSATLDVWAIGLENSNGQWDVRIFRNNGNSEAHPKASVSVPDEYTMFGGGAQLNYSGPGSLLTASYPISTNSWRGEGKDHLVPSASSITVSAIGVRPTNGSAKPRTQMFSVTSQSAAHPAAILQPVVNESVVISGGASANWRGPGSLLTAIYPNDNNTAWVGAAKDHIVPDPSTITVYAIVVAKPDSPNFDPQLAPLLGAPVPPVPPVPPIP